MRFDDRCGLGSVGNWISDCEESCRRRWYGPHYYMTLKRSGNERRADEIVTI